MESPSVILRNEQPGDHAAIRAVIEAAFGQPNEANLVDQLRLGGGLTASLVAMLHDQVIGHIAFIPVTIGGQALAPPALALAPVAVRPEHQRRGIGGQLIRAGLDKVREAGHGLVIVLGHPEYYPRFGFIPAGQFGIECPFSVPHDAFMALELIPGTLDRCRGVVQYRPEFTAI